MMDPLYIVSVSGGKDSAAVALHLRELGIPFEAVFANTGWEAPETYTYLRGPLAAALGPIVEVQGRDGGMVGAIRRKGMFPSRVRRWCTDELKLRPLFDYMFARLEQTGRPIVNVVGVRAEESAQRAALPERDGYRDQRGEIEVWRPIIRWTEADVVAVHHRHGLAPNPLYLAGARRVGCWPCIFSRKEEIRMVADRSPEVIDRIRELEAEVTERRGRTRAYFAGQGPADLGGRAGYMPIDRAVEWSRTSDGGRQMLLVDDRDPDEGCLRWGLCERGGR
jgi:3'-phosphoadenosine 5'-phosphosulfate sulfotransferase (PAPS reductase)/FAD synthetase